MYTRNWKIINAKRKERWNAMDEEGKRHMLEEQELNRKAKVLKELMEEVSGGYRLTLKGITNESPSIMRLLEWGFDVQWGIKVLLRKYPGIRFDKLEGCADIIPNNDRTKAKLGLVSKEAVAAEQALEYAANKIKEVNPSVAAALETLIKAVKETK
jgi:hypothetical protein